MATRAAKARRPYSETETACSPSLAVGAATIQAIHARVILSFLGGARFGRAFDQPGRGAVVALSMIPSIMRFFILALPREDAASKLNLLAAALVMALAWDPGRDQAQGWPSQDGGLETAGAPRSYKPCRK